MKPLMRYFSVGVPLYLLFLIALFPAVQAYRFAAEPLARALPELKLGGLEGTVWSGHARMLAYQRVLQGQASWQLSPLPLLFGKASLTALFQTQEGFLQSRLTVPLSGGSLELSDVEGRLPVTELAGMAPPLPLLLDGVVSLNLPALVIDAGGRILAVEGSIIWHQAAISAPQALTFGDLELVLHTGDGGQVVGEISDRGGPLRVAGTLQLLPEGTYRVNATVAAAPDAPASLVQSLGWLGKPDTQGGYRLSYSGRL